MSQQDGSNWPDGPTTITTDLEEGEVMGEDDMLEDDYSPGTLVIDHIEQIEQGQRQLLVDVYNQATFFYYSHLSITASFLGPKEWKLTSVIGPLLYCSPAVGWG